MKTELAALKQADPVRYEELLASLKAKRVRVGELDRAVKAAIKTTTKQNEPQEDEDLAPHWKVAPWPEKVDTGELLDELTHQITRYVATLEKRAVILALWTMFSYVHDFATHSPMLLVTSPEPDSGKTTLLGVLNYLTRRALMSVEISGPALFRSLEKSANVHHRRSRRSVRQER
jgi:hypothetical protein